MIDLVCNDPSTCSQDQRFDQPTQVGFQSNPSQSNFEQSLAINVDNLVISIVKSAFSEISTNESTTTNSHSSEDRRLIEFDVPCEDMEYDIAGSIDNEIVESVNIVCNVNNHEILENYVNGMVESIIENIPTCTIDDNSQSLPVSIDNVNVNANIVNLEPILSTNANSFPSGFEVIDPSTKIPPFEIDGLAIDTDLPEPSVPNFSLEIDFKNDQLQPVNSDFHVESHVDLDLNSSQESSGIPDSDEIQIVQFT
ncbi:hypothetical protein AVEN_7640-1, partial [Araneus ventricosus]